MKWLFVKKGDKHPKIIFVVCNDSGKPIHAHTDMNLAMHYESNHEFTNSVIDFNNMSKQLIEAGWEGKHMEDKRPIIDIHQFKRICKEHKTELKL